MTQENHQDYICMTMITAGAAMLAAVFFIFNLGHPDNSTGSAWTATGDRAKQQSITDVATYGNHSIATYGDHSVEAYGNHATTALQHPATTQLQFCNTSFSTRMRRRAWGQTKWTAQCR